jgi:hypothetical protein
MRSSAWTAAPRAVLVAAPAARVLTELVAHRAADRDPRAALAQLGDLTVAREQITAQSTRRVWMIRPANMPVVSLLMTRPAARRRGHASTASRNREAQIGHDLTADAAAGSIDPGVVPHRVDEQTVNRARPAAPNLAEASTAPQRRRRSPGPRHGNRA